MRGFAVRVAKVYTQSRAHAPVQVRFAVPGGTAREPERTPPRCHSLNPGNPGGQNG